MRITGPALATAMLLSGGAAQAAEVDAGFFGTDGTTLLGSLTRQGPANTPSFFGFASDAGPIGRVALVDLASDLRTVALDDYVTAPPAIAAVPEPATWALLIGGFGLTGGALRGRRAAARVRFA